MFQLCNRMQIIICYDIIKIDKRTNNKFLTHYFIYLFFLLLQMLLAAADVIIVCFIFLSNFFFSLSFVKHGAGGKNVPECNPEPLYLKEKKTQIVCAFNSCNRNL